MYEMTIAAANGGKPPCLGRSRVAEGLGDFGVIVVCAGQWLERPGQVMSGQSEQGRCSEVRLTGRREGRERQMVTDSKCT